MWESDELEGGAGKVGVRVFRGVCVYLPCTDAHNVSPLSNMWATSWLVTLRRWMMVDLLAWFFLVVLLGNDPGSRSVETAERSLWKLRGRCCFHHWRARERKKCRTFLAFLVRWMFKCSQVAACWKTPPSLHVRDTRLWEGRVFSSLGTKLLQMVTEKLTHVHRYSPVGTFWYWEALSQ